MNTECAAIVLSCRPYGEGSAVVRVFAQETGCLTGLVYGGTSRRQAALWQPGNIIHARYVARLDTQLGRLSGELVHEVAVRFLEDPTRLMLLNSVVALLTTSLADGESDNAFFLRTCEDILAFSRVEQRPPVTAYILWELFFLSALGFGLSLDTCAVSGKKTDLTFVSPKSGRAVSGDHAGVWRDRLLPLPSFLCDGKGAEREAYQPAWVSGLALTGYFIEKHVYAARHKGLPYARRRLAEHISNLSEKTND